MSATPNLGLPYIDAGQAQKHVTHNEALRFLDSLVQLAVLDRDLTTPPSSPIEGQRWIVKTGASDAWSGHADHIAAWQDGAWQFSAPVAGWVAYVIDEEILVAWDGDSWNSVSTGEGSGGSDPTELQDMTLLGIGTTADTTNPVSAKINNVLWTAKTVAEGGDGTLRYKLSKESAAKTLSFLFQNNFSGRAEIGLAGDDDFHFKVSPDGTTWLEAIKIDRATGKLSFPISGGPREMLSANRTYYVRTDGSDSNTGLFDSSGGAFLTIQKALTTVSALDCSTFNITIQIKDGTYTGSAVWAGHMGSGTVTLQGNSSTPANVLLSVTSSNAITLQTGTRLTVKDLKITTTTSGTHFYISPFATLTFGNIEFGSSAARHIICDGGFVIASSSYAISGAALRHIEVVDGGAYLASGITVTISGTPAWSGEFIYGSLASKVTLFSVTYSGSATGKRYTLDTNAVINSFGAGSASTYFPGNSNGTTATGGQQA